MTDQTPQAEFPESPDSDINDLDEVVADAIRRRAPKGVVPREVRDDRPLPVGPGESYSIDELTDDGVARFEGTAFIAPPIMPKPQNGANR
jgi:hypothetical protein